MALDLSAFERFAKVFQKNDILFCEFEPGDTFYLIQSGRVQITKIINNIEKTIDILKPGEVFGEMAILEGAPRSASAIALDRVKVLEFNKTNFEILIMGNPQIALKLLKLFTKRIYDQNRRFMILTLKDEPARVADVFLMLNDTGNATYLNKEAREFKSTVDDIAHWAGMTPSRCSSILNHFVSQQRIEIFPDRIILNNVSDFERFVNSKRNKK